MDLAELEAETSSILERFGRGKSVARSSRQHLSSAPIQSKRGSNVSAFNRSFKRSTSAYSRPASTSVVLKTNKRETNVIPDDIRLFKADGTASNQLRHTISTALSGNKFDSVPTLLASSLSDNNYYYDSRPQSSFRERAPSIVSVVGGKNRPLKKSTSSTISAVNPVSLSSLSLRDVKYAGSESNPKPSSEIDPEKEVCFNCWSAGEGMKCTIHAKQGSSNSIGQSVSVCSNWDVSYLRRKYRAEEIQEVFSAQSETLVFNKSQQQFSTQQEPKHPIYRLVNQHVARLNFTYQRRQNTKIWLKSFISKLKEGTFNNNRSAQSAKVLCFRGTENNMAQVHQLSREMADKLPKAPVTGTTMREKLGREQVLVEHVVNVDGNDKTCQLVVVGPAPVPQALYRPRKYEASPPVKFILPSNLELSSESEDMRELDFFSLLRDRNNFVDYGTFARKSSNSTNLAVGGLSTQMLVSKQFTRSFPPQYKDITCSDDSLMVPPRQTTPSTVPTLEVPPDNLTFVSRALVTPLDNRRPPTIMTKVGIGPNERHYFGLNRVEQTGEEEDFGFRTSTWYTLPEPNDKIDTNTFRPSESIATPNALAITPFRIMRVDDTYPFCQEKSRTNRVEDLYQLTLSNGDCSSSKLQVFTTVGSQQCGYFMQNGDASLPIGRMITKVIRTWAFLQGEPNSIKRGEDPDIDPPVDRIYKEETLSLGLDGVVLNARPRYQEMPEGVLATCSRADARDAILKRSIGNDNKLDIKADVMPDRPCLEGLLDAVASTRVGKKHTAYLKYPLNLPAPQCNAKVKPRTSLEEWAGYNPWTNGKTLLSTHFVRSLSQETKNWPKANHNKVDPPESNTAKEFAALCSLVRHGRYRDLEDTLNNPDWTLPIDYVDESGNTLLMVACQNGNRRIVKLCLRRGSQINKQNLNGNSCLHFAFGYGFGKFAFLMTSKASM
jgi:hypothetical protein